MKLKPFYGLTRFTRRASELISKFVVFLFSLFEIDLETIINGRSVPWSFGCTKRRPEIMKLKPFYGTAF